MKEKGDGIFRFTKGLKFQVGIREEKDMDTGTYETDTDVEVKGENTVVKGHRNIVE